jgi:hypothetical protein
MIKDITIALAVLVAGFIVGFYSGLIAPHTTTPVVATNGRYVGVIETGDGTAQAIAFSNKEACETAAQKIRTIVKDLANADALAQAGGKVWLMPCTPVNSELITK